MLCETFCARRRIHLVHVQFFLRAPTETSHQRRLKYINLEVQVQLEMEVVGVRLCGADDVCFELPDGDNVIVDRALISSSTILSDVVLSVESDADEKILPTPAGFLPAWLDLASSGECAASATIESLMFSMQVRYRCNIALVVWVCCACVR